MEAIHKFIITLSIFLLLSYIVCESPEEVKKKRALLIKKHLKRLKKVDGAIKLVGGRGEFEGRFKNI